MRLTDIRPGEVPVGSLCVIEDPDADPTIASSGYVPSQGGILRCGLHHRNSLQGGTMAAATGSVVATSAYDDFPFREAIQAPVAVNRIGEVVVEQPLLAAEPPSGSSAMWPPSPSAVSTATTATQSPPRVTFAMDQQTSNAVEN